MNRKVSFNREAAREQHYARCSPVLAVTVLSIVLFGAASTAFVWDPPSVQVCSELDNKNMHLVKQEERVRCKTAKNC